jgi:hypothetical protein
MDQTQTTIDVKKAIENFAREKNLTSEEVSAMISRGYDNGSRHERTEAAVAAIAENVLELSKRLNAKIAEEQNEVEAAKYKEIEAKAVAEFKGLPADAPERLAFYNETKAILGESRSALATFGTDLQKSLQAPISRNDPDKEKYTNFRKAIDDIVFGASAYGAVVPNLQKNLTITAEALDMGVKMVEKYSHRYGGTEIAEAVRKSVGGLLDSATAGGALEWVPLNILSQDIYESVWLDQVVAQQFTHITMPGPTYQVPILIGRSTMYAMDEAKTVADYLSASQANYTVGNTLRASNPDSSYIQFTARKYAVLELASDEIFTDANPDIMRILRDDAVYAFKKGIENAVVNGSRSLTDLDNQGADAARLWANSADAGDGVRLNTGVVDQRYLWNGLRKACYTSSSTTLLSGALARVDLLNAVAALDKYGVDLTQLFFVMNPKTWVKISGFPEVSTLEKFGPNATILKGQVGSINGIPILITAELPNNYDNLGYFTNGTVVGGSAGVATKTGILLCHKRAWAFGDYLSLRVESDRNIFTQARAMVMSARGDFRKMYAGAEKTEHYITNV